MKKLAAIVLLGILSVGWSMPALAGARSDAKSQSRASRKAEKQQRKAQKRYAKAQRKAQRKMIKRDRKNTRYPK